MTVRNGPEVRRLKFETLDEALEEVRRQIEPIVAGEPLDAANAIRDYEPQALVKARIEISGKGFISPPTAGVDIRGDNSLLGFTGGVARRPLEGATATQVLGSIREALLK